MIGKKDTVAIFESYKNYLKEQSENEMELNQIIDTLLFLIQKDPTKSIQGKDLTKLIQFLGQPKMLESYKSFHIEPMKMDAGVMGDGGITKKSEGDAGAVNMGKGGTLELQQGQKFTPGQLR